MKYQAFPTCVRVIPCIVFVDPPLVLSENLQSLIVLLCAVGFVVLQRMETAAVSINGGVWSVKQQTSSDFSLACTFPYNHKHDV